MDYETKLYLMLYKLGLVNLAKEIFKNFWKHEK